MRSWQSLERFLTTDPSDAGCAETFQMLDRYIERQLAHGDAATFYPQIALHLSGCNPCLQDFEGLVAALGGPAGPSGRERSAN